MAWLEFGGNKKAPVHTNLVESSSGKELAKVAPKKKRQKEGVVRPWTPTAIASVPFLPV